MIESQIILLISCALGAYAITEAVKRFWAGYLKSKNMPEPWYFNHVLRFLATLIGGIFGFLNGQILLEVAIGLGGGGLMTFIVAAIKKRIKNV